MQGLARDHGAHGLRQQQVEGERQAKRYGRRTVDGGLRRCLATLVTWSPGTHVPAAQLRPCGDGVPPCGTWKSGGSGARTKKTRCNKQWVRSRLAGHAVQRAAPWASRGRALGEPRPACDTVLRGQSETMSYCHCRVPRAWRVPCPSFLHSSTPPAAYSCPAVANCLSSAGFWESAAPYGTLPTCLDTVPSHIHSSTPPSCRGPTSQHSGPLACTDMRGVQVDDACTFVPFSHTNSREASMNTRMDHRMEAPSERPTAVRIHRFLREREGERHNLAQHHTSTIQWLIRLAAGDMYQSSSISRAGVAALGIPPGWLAGWRNIVPPTQA